MHATASKIPWPRDVGRRCGTRKMSRFREKVERCNEASDSCTQDLQGFFAGLNRPLELPASLTTPLRATMGAVPYDGVTSNLTMG